MSQFTQQVILGLLLGMVQNEGDAWVYTLDALGRRIESVDALGNKTWRFYDYAGQPTFVVRGVSQDNAGLTGAPNGYGEVTETRYNAFGQVVDSIAYTGRIAIAVAGTANVVMQKSTDRGKTFGRQPRNGSSRRRRSRCRPPISRWSSRWSSCWRVTS